MKIFVGNLSIDTTREDVKEIFMAHGNVGRVILRKRSGGDNPRGFGTVDMSDEACALAAIKALNNQTFKGRIITVTAAIIKDEKPKKDWKKIKRLKKEAKLAISEPSQMNDNVPEIKEAKTSKIWQEEKPYSGRKGPSTWKKRIGRGLNKAWKKKPGGIKKKFKNKLTK